MILVPPSNGTTMILVPPANGIVMVHFPFDDSERMLKSSVSKTLDVSSLGIEFN